MKKIDIAYLAGLVDGEGSIGIYHNGQSLVGRITVVSTTPAPLRWAKKLSKFGSLRSYNPKIKRHSKGWVWVILSRQAAKLAESLLPFLRIKRKQAVNLLSFQSGIGKAGARVSSKETKRRIRLSKISRRLNKRGR